jgi:predicted NUDIX family NTP pyrophosphohydrolase
MSLQLSAGLLMYRFQENEIEFFLVHPGGPFFKNKDLGVWSIPKGLPEQNEDLLTTAQREFNEETGLNSNPPFHELGTIQQKSGKVVHAWAFMGEWDPADGITCNTFEIEWPPKSGKFQKFPEQDRASWLSYDEAVKHINPAQIPLLDKALAMLSKKAN